jgi:hypothetical protein
MDDDDDCCKRCGPGGPEGAAAPFGRAPGRGISRRRVLSLSFAAGAGYLLSPALRPLFAAGSPGVSPSPSASPGGSGAAAATRAEHLIVLWMAGGPSHIDTFDPKPGRSTGGSFRTVSTALPGVSFSQHLPQLAASARDLVVVRSMTSKEGSHGRGSFLLHTGYVPNPTVKYPALGAIVSHERGSRDFDLPNFVSLGGPSEGAGFFGPEHAPFVVRTKPGQPIENLRYFQRVDSKRFEERLKLVEFMDASFAAAGAAAEAEAHEQILRKAKRMIQSPLVKAFDLDGESEAARKAYGMNDFGQRCLMARRLVEAGVRAVEVELTGWDTHENNFERSRKLMARLDPAFATLIEDLKQSGLLDRTLVVCMGEFGRSPRINPRDGRDHHPRAFSMAMAGGGIRTGQVIGATDADGREVAARPVQVADLFATVLARLGIDPNKMYTSNDRPLTLANKGQVLREITG